jgi:hypothetical protein
MPVFLGCYKKNSGEEILHSDVPRGTLLQFPVKRTHFTRAHKGESRTEVIRYIDSIEKEVENQYKTAETRRNGERQGKFGIYNNETL